MKEFISQGLIHYEQHHTRKLIKRITLVVQDADNEMKSTHLENVYCSVEFDSAYLEC